MLSTDKSHRSRGVVLRTQYTMQGICTSTLIFSFLCFCVSSPVRVSILEFIQSTPYSAFYTLYKIRPSSLARSDLTRLLS
ncbi:hypothetical protein BDW74DRAFT_142425 [Aspergillus multicolor]|uniref:uncharacterized protein n=1 Tax=Aspergillus multicolor TaxID=41759 RepID=UPI003CCD9EBF